MSVSSERRLADQIAAHESWANTVDRSARTAPARAAMLARFEAEVDPEGVLDPAERTRRAQHKRKAYFQWMARKSAQARRTRSSTKADRRDLPEADLQAAWNYLTTYGLG